MQVKNKEQVWERFIEMNEDNQLFTFTDDKKGFLDYTGKVMNVIGSKNVMLEELAREVLVQTLLRTERKYLGSEIEVNVDGAKCRADLVVNINNEYASCIELKEVDVDKLTTGSLNLVIEDAFAQVGSRYLSKFNKDCFISVVVMDMNVILSKENALTLYHNLLVEQKKSLLSTLKKYGICIVTKKYNLLSQQIEKDIWYSIPSTMRFYEKKDDSSLFGISKLFLKLDEAVNLRTSSSNSGGSKNVRDIKDGNHVLGKRMLVLSILSTLIEAFNKNDPYYFARAGGSKKIVVVEDETLTFTARVGDDISYAISTMNGALIDGQNSLDSVACIMEAIENKLNPKSASGILEKQIFDRLSKSFNTADKLSHFLRFIKDSFVGIEVSKAKDEEEASKITFQALMEEIFI